MLYSVYMQNDSLHLPEDKDGQMYILGLCFLIINFLKGAEFQNKLTK